MEEERRVRFRCSTVVSVPCLRRSLRPFFFMEPAVVLRGECFAVQGRRGGAVWRRLVGRVLIFFFLRRSGGGCTWWHLFFLCCCVPRVLVSVLVAYGGGSAKTERQHPTPQTRRKSSSAASRLEVAVYALRAPTVLFVPKSLFRVFLFLNTARILHQSPQVTALNARDPMYRGGPTVPFLSGRRREQSPPSQSRRGLLELESSGQKKYPRALVKISCLDFVGSISSNDSAASCGLGITPLPI